MEQNLHRHVVAVVLLSVARLHQEIFVWSYHRFPAHNHFRRLRPHPQPQTLSLRRQNQLRVRTK